MNHRHFTSKERRLWRKIRIRKKITGTKERPRVCVFKSNKYIYAQAIDDDEGRTICSASSLEEEFKDMKGKSKKNIKISERIGEILSERLKEKGIEKVVFDRSGYKYHGRVKAIAEALRKAGLLN